MLVQFRRVLIFPKMPHLTKIRKMALQANSHSSHGMNLNQVYEYARHAPTPVILENLIEFGNSPSPEQLLDNAKFLHREIPIRVAHRIKELDNMPYGLSQEENVHDVRSVYITSFNILRSMKCPTNEFEELEFTKQLEQLVSKHKHVVPMISKGLRNIREEYGPHFMDHECPYLADFLDRFYFARVGLRFIAQQHLTMHEPREGYVGMIQLECSPARVLQGAIDDATFICQRNYGDAPEVNIFDPGKVTFTYPPRHLEIMAEELLFNSMRAVMEFCPDEPSPINIVICGGNDEISIKISDIGGGIPRSMLAQIWTYTFTTANRREQANFNDTETHGIKRIGHNIHMGGDGAGLPLTRLYARYFGGDLEVISMHGHGTDAYLYLPKLADLKEQFHI